MRDAVERRLVVVAVFLDGTARFGRAGVPRCFAGDLRDVVVVLRRVDCVTVKLPVLVLLE